MGHSDSATATADLWTGNNKTCFLGELDQILGLPNTLRPDLSTPISLIIR